MESWLNTHEGFNSRGKTRADILTGSKENPKDTHYRLEYVNMYCIYIKKWIRNKAKLVMYPLRGDKTPGFLPDRVEISCL